MPEVSGVEKCLCEKCEEEEFCAKFILLESINKLQDQVEAMKNCDNCQYILYGKDCKEDIVKLTCWHYKGDE